MCTQGCQTFMWGGKGSPIHDDEGECFCACGENNDSWSDKNILSRASCVPAKAHLLYGLVGLALSTAALCHAAYHLRRQVSPKPIPARETSGCEGVRVFSDRVFVRTTSS